MLKTSLAAVKAVTLSLIFKREQQDIAFLLPQSRNVPSFFQ